MTRKPRQQSSNARRGLLALAGLLGLAVLVPEASDSLLASDRTIAIESLGSAELSVASRVAPPAPDPAQVEAEFARTVIELTNVERAAAGVAPVTALPELNLAASFHTADQKNTECRAGVLTHVGTDGSRGVDRIQRTGLDISFWGENIACGHTTPEAVVQGWMNSPGHRVNLLDPRHTHIGVHVDRSDSDGLFYWVQNFATPR